MESLSEWLRRPQEVAGRLKALKVHADLTGRQLAERLGWDPSKVSRIENAKHRPTPAEIEAWVAACGASPDIAAELNRLEADARVVAAVDFRTEMAQGHGRQQEDYVRLFAEAVLIRDFETAYVPGLLQIPDYVRRVKEEAGRLHDAPVDIEGGISARAAQQQNLYRSDRRFEFIICEPVLRYLLVPATVMRAQLDRLQAVIGLPNVRLGIIPMGRELAWTPQHSFQVYDNGTDVVVEVESVVKAPWYRDGDAARFGEFFDLLWTEAVEGNEARALIIAATQALP